jgi:hypothetical protein
LTLYAPSYFVFGFSAISRGISAKQRKICCFAAQKREEICLKSMVGLDWIVKNAEKKIILTLYAPG